ncbi:NAD(P)/FAD-dependent oxidoreductase [Candidatus Uhrbacteria bacterium]|nr:NAD(P)/FAD-dependent oxidoreductase [Candidatus Uhrbacteria bacterium]
MRYLIIGGGIAGTTAAEVLRKSDASAEITIVDEEQHPLYSRVLLGHYLKGKVSRERVFLKPATWYQEHNIEWLPGVVAEQLDTRNKFVRISDQRELPYDKLLIASGTVPRPLEVDLRGVSYLRTIDDADHLLQLLSERGMDARMGIYGSGFIACEYLELFREMNLPITLAYRGDKFWSRALLPEAGELVNKVLVDGGVELHTRAELKDLIGEKELTGFVTPKGTHEVTLLGVGVGVIPDFSWLRDAGVELGSGVKTNQFLETNVPDVYAAGDVAEFEDVVLGRQLVLMNWQNAMSQGRHVARVMAGERVAFELVSSYSINIFGLECIFVGDTELAEADNVHLIGSLESGGITQVFERSERVVGGVMLNRNSDRVLITKAIKNKQPFSELTFVTE